MPISRAPPLCESVEGSGGESGVALGCTAGSGLSEPTATTTSSATGTKISGGTQEQAASLQAAGCERRLTTCVALREKGGAGRFSATYRTPRERASLSAEEASGVSGLRAANLRATTQKGT